MDGSDSLMHHWDHLHTLLSVVALMFAYLALRASKKLKVWRLENRTPVAETQTAPAQNTQAESHAPDSHADIAQLLTLMQQHARLLDFVSEDITHFSDQQVGAVARVVHSGLQKVLRENLSYQAILAQPEQAAIQIPAQFDAQRIRLIGQPQGQGPYQGQLIHGGWQLNQVNLPKRGRDYQANILQPAEVEV
jgi:hypothetical protein